VLQDDLEELLPLSILRDVRSLELQMQVQELPASWAGLTCLKVFTIKLPLLIMDFRLPRRMKEVAINVNELSFVVEHNMATFATFQRVAQTCLEDRDNAMSGISSINFCVMLSHLSGPLHLTMKQLEEQCLKAAECCTDLILRVSHAYVEGFPHHY
jgi:hypothetical protein